MTPPTILRATLLLALASCALTASAQNLVLDGGFEGAAVKLYGPGEPLGAWTALGDVLGPEVSDRPGETIGGANSLYNFTTGSGVQQALATVENRSYVLAFDAVDRFGIFELQVDFGTSSRTIRPGGLRRYAFEFVATGASTSLRLFSPGGGFTGIDDVSVEAVPEPAPTVALGLGALGLLRRRRKA